MSYLPKHFLIFEVDRLHNLSLKNLRVQLLELWTVSMTGEEVVLRLSNLHLHISHFLESLQELWTLETNLRATFYSLCELARVANRGLGQISGSCKKIEFAHYLGINKSLSTASIKSCKLPLRREQPLEIGSGRHQGPINISASYVNLHHHCIKRRSANNYMIVQMLTSFSE